MDDRDGNSGEQAERDEALLSIGKAVVFVGEAQPGEDGRRVDEVQPVLLQVERTLALRPGERDGHSVYTKRGCSNGSGAQLQRGQQPRVEWMRAGHGCVSMHPVINSSTTNTASTTSFVPIGNTVVAVGGTSRKTTLIANYYGCDF